MTIGLPILSIYRVSTSGEVLLVAANVPYTEVSWTRRFSTCGEMSAQLACPLPVEWPGRYLATLSDHDEVAVLEKPDASEGADGDSAVLYGRFAESFWDRYKLGAGGESERGANWRQAVTAAAHAWHMADVPAIADGLGTAASTGSSYAISGAAGDSAMESIYSCCASNGAHPLLSYDRAAGALELSIVTGLDRTRSQSENTIWIFSLGMGTASGVSYSGDYSCSCSEVVAHAEKDVDEQTVSVTRTVAVPGFDASTQWLQRAYEDVGSLIDQDATPTTSLVDSAGLLRAYDHMPALSIDSTVAGVGYRSSWDLGDLVEVEMPSMSYAASERVEEVRETWSTDGPSVEATLGTKAISKVRRALMGRR